MILYLTRQEMSVGRNTIVYFLCQFLYLSLFISTFSAIYRQSLVCLLFSRGMLCLNRQLLFPVSQTKPDLLQLCHERRDTISCSVINAGMSRVLQLRCTVHRTIFSALLCRARCSDLQFVHRSHCVPCRDNSLVCNGESQKPQYMQVIICGAVTVV